MTLFPFKAKDLYDTLPSFFRKDHLFSGNTGSCEELNCNSNADTLENHFFFFFLLGKIFRMNILKSAFLFPFLGVTRVLISVLRHVHVCVYLGLIHLSAYLRILSVCRRAWTDPWLRVSQDNAVLGAIADFNLCLQSQATRFWAPTAQSSRIYSKKRIPKCWDRISATCFATSGNFCFSGFKI